MIETLLPYTTPQERRVVYEAVRKIFKERSEKDLWGMCLEIRHAIMGHPSIMSLSIKIMDDIYELKAFPELVAQKPTKMHNKLYWYPLNFEGVERRIAALTKAIELCNK